MMKKFQLGYYAHSMAIYNSDLEKFEYDYLSDVFDGLVICPNKHVGERRAIQPYLDIVERVDVLFVSEYKGYVGSGVYQEIQTALTHNIKIQVITHPTMDVQLKDFKNVKIVNHSNLRAYAMIEYC